MMREGMFFIAAVVSVFDMSCGRNVVSLVLNLLDDIDKWERGMRRKTIPGIVTHVCLITDINVKYR